MTPRNILDITYRNDFRKWLVNNSATEKECWIAVDEAASYLYALNENEKNLYRYKLSELVSER